MRKTTHGVNRQKIGNLLYMAGKGISLAILYLPFFSLTSILTYLYRASLRLKNGFHANSDLDAPYLRALGAHGRLVNTGLDMLIVTLTFLLITSIWRFIRGQMPFKLPLWHFMVSLGGLVLIIYLFMTDFGAWWFD